MLKSGTSSLVYFFLLFLVACGPSGEQAATLNPGAGALQVSPNAFSKGEIINLSFPKHHPSGLAIRNPRGEWFYLQYSDDKKGILPEQEFKAADSLQLDTGALVGVVWRDGKKLEEAVFTHAGEYMVYMADNLETEPENTFHFMATIMLTGD